MPRTRPQDEGDWSVALSCLALGHTWDPVHRAPMVGAGHYQGCHLLRQSATWQVPQEQLQVWVPQGEPRRGTVWRLRYSTSSYSSLSHSGYRTGHSARHLAVTLTYLSPTSHRRHSSCCSALVHAAPRLCPQGQWPWARTCDAHCLPEFTGSLSFSHTSLTRPLPCPDPDTLSLIAMDWMLVSPCNSYVEHIPT